MRINHKDTKTTKEKRKQGSPVALITLPFLVAVFFLIFVFFVSSW